MSKNTNHQSCQSFDILRLGLWKLRVINEDSHLIAVCPQCNKKLDESKIERNPIKACETGYYYCSDECAEIHVKDNKPEGGY